MKLFKETQREAEQWIQSGGKCIYRYGWAYRGAPAKVITKEEALEMLPHFSFGTGFYELSWLEYNDEVVLEFNELGENDLL